MTHSKWPPISQAKSKKEQKAKQENQEIEDAIGGETGGTSAYGTMTFFINKGKHSKA